MTTAAPGRERILDAALRLFAERGHDAVTVRDIATAAEVSPALIVHHFGSKDALRREADARVIGLFDHMTADATAGGAGEGFLSLLLTQIPPGSPIPAYLRRLLLSGDPAGRELFQRWHALTATVLEGMTDAGTARASADPDARAAFLMANDLAMILLHEHIAGAIGSDPLTPDGAGRWAADAVDAYTRGVFIEPTESPQEIS